MTTEPASLALVADTVTTACAAVAVGHLVEMSGLDLAVLELCSAAVMLPAQHRGRAARKLARLARDLSALSEALTAQRVALEHAAEAEARHRAVGAYGTDTAQP